MCCFSGPVEEVRDTKIFARLTERGTQFVVYQMDFATKVDNAIILPLPVAPGEASIDFVDLHGYPKFFEDLAQGFPKKPPFRLLGGKGALGSAKASSPLIVEQVGDYIASFVPSVADFSRLDERFRIRAEVWSQLPAYADYGFAVFQLAIRSGRPHPMAFEFATRHTDRIFFPTVHIHDGEVHAEGHFDHTLYLQDASFDAAVDDYQDRDVVDAATGFVRSDRPVRAFTKPNDAMRILAGDQLVHRKELHGSMPNEDQLVPFAQASIVPPQARRWGLRVGALMVGAAGLGWIIARRRKLKRADPPAARARHE